MRTHKELPVVSIVCIAYNQAKYIRQTIDSFLMQRTTFSFEVLIHDDASTDGTAEIIKEYAKKYPEIIKPELDDKNQYSQGAFGFINETFRRAKGEYIAFCEGDDYWTDVNKLQKQVEFLETHKEYALCFHPVKVMFDNKDEADSIFPEDTSGFTVEKLLERNFIQTNSVMYRRQNYDSMPDNIIPGDWYMHLYHAQYGKIGFINKIMSVYRRHPGGVWWGSYNNPSLLWKKYGDKYIRLLHEIMRLYGNNPKYKRIILSNHIAGSYEAMAQLSPDDINDVAVESIKIAPNETWDYIRLLIDQIKYHSAKSKELNILLKHETINSREKDHAIELLRTRLKRIESTWVWKLFTIYRRLRNRATKLLKSDDKDD